MPRSGLPRSLPRSMSGPCRGRSVSARGNCGDSTMVPRLRSRASARSRSSPRSLPRSTPRQWSRASAAAGRDSDRKASRLESQRARRPGPSAPRAPGTRHAARASGTRHGTPGRARTLTRAPQAACLVPGAALFTLAHPAPRVASPARPAYLATARSAGRVAGLPRGSGASSRRGGRARLRK